MRFPRFATDKGDPQNGVSFRLGVNVLPRVRARPNDAPSGLDLGGPDRRRPHLRRADGQPVMGPLNDTDERHKFPHPTTRPSGSPRNGPFLLAPSDW